MLITRILRGLFRLVAILALALCFSILFEWIGMVSLWPEQGVRHSEQMLAQELHYLNEEFTRSILAAEPVLLARAAADGFDRALEAIGVYRLIAWLRSTRPASGMLVLVHDLFGGTHKYLEAMATTAQTFVVRLTVLALAMPAFLLFCLVGLAEGLMRRDLRRWGGGRESSFLYHHSKKLLAPPIIVAWMLYLALPFSISPNWVLMPCAILFAGGVAMTTATFKKYL